MNGRRATLALGLLLPACAGPATAQAQAPSQAQAHAQAQAPSQVQAQSEPAHHGDPPQQPLRLDPDSPYPPAVLSGTASLVCDISAKANGHQRLTLVGGAGLEFDVTVSPIIDGTVTTKGPDKGGGYRFTSHLAKPAKAHLAGAGDVDLEALETKVLVEMNRYDQPKGPGTTISFSSSDMSNRGIYIEFTGRAKAANGDRYAFRVNLGAATGGRGAVEPADTNNNSRIVSKMVMVEAPATTVVTTITQKLR